MPTIKVAAMIRQLPADVRSYLRSGVAITSVTQCVEELFLNAVDAGASCVAVRIDLDAFKVQVVDNGSGVPLDQLALLGERYSTSKCHLMIDLDNLCYYGYRGEALASMRDSCGILEITTRTDASAKTYCKLFQNGRALKVTESSKPRFSVGTTVTVHDLFSNFPVKRKSTNRGLELEKIRQRLEGLALLKPEVSVSLRNDVTGNVILQTHKSNSTITTFSSLYGAEKAKSLVEVSGNQGHFSVKGFIGKAAHPKKDLQFVFINGRLVLKSKVHKNVNQAMAKCVIFKRGYGQNSSTPELTQRQSSSTSPTKFLDKHPIYILDVKCPLTEYDITFEPAKTLVEFKNWDPLLQCITDVVNAFLKKEKLSATPDLTVSTFEGKGSSDGVDIEDSEKAAGRISPTLLIATLTSKKVKLHVTKTSASSKDLYKTPHTMSLEEWKAMEMSKKLDSSSTDSVHRSIDDSENDKTTDTDGSAPTETSLSSAAEDNTNNSIQASVCNTHGNKINGKKIEMKEHKEIDCDKQQNNQVKQASTGNLQRDIAETESAPQSSLSLYRKAVGKPCTSTSNVSVESSLKKVSTLFPEHKSKSCLSSLQRFRKGSENTMNLNSKAYPETSYNSSKDTSDIQSVSLKELQMIADKFKCTRQQTSDRGDHVANRQRFEIEEFHNLAPDISNGTRNYESKQHQSGIVTTRVNRKRMSDTRDPCRTTASKLSRLVQERTASVTIDPDPSAETQACTSSDKRYQQDNLYQGPSHVNFPHSSTSDHTLKVVEMPGKVDPRLGHRSVSKNVLEHHRDAIQSKNISYEETMSSFANWNLPRQHTSVATMSMPDRNRSSSSFVKECTSTNSYVMQQPSVTCIEHLGFPETAGNLPAVSGQPIYSEHVIETDPVTEDISNFTNDASSCELMLPNIITHSLVEIMDTQGAEQSERDRTDNPPENGSSLFTAVPLSIDTVCTIPVASDQARDAQEKTIEIDGSEQFGVSTQEFSPKLSQSSLNNEMTKITLSQGFIPAVENDSVSNIQSDICKTPESEGFSPHLDYSMSTDETNNSSKDGGASHTEDNRVNIEEVKEAGNKDGQELKDTNANTAYTDSTTMNSRKCVTETLQRSPDTLDVTIADDSIVSKKQTDNQPSVCSENFTSEDLSVTQLLDRAADVKTNKFTPNLKSGDNFTFSDIFSPSQSNKLTSSVCDKCHDKNDSPNVPKNLESADELQLKSASPNASWNTTWSSVNEDKNTEVDIEDHTELDDTLNDMLKTQIDSNTNFEYPDQNMNIAYNEFENGKPLKENMDNLEKDEILQPVPERDGEEKSPEQSAGHGKLIPEQDGNAAPGTKGYQVSASNSSSASEDDPGQWLEMKDPATGKQLFVHTKSGATVYGSSFKGNNQKDTAPVRLERLFSAPGSVRLKPTTSSDARGDPTPRPGSSRVVGLVDEFLEKDEEDAEVKWRSPRARNQTEAERGSGLESLFQEWTNPALDCPSKEVTTAEVSGLPSRAVVNAYKSMHTCTFTKDMLEDVQVVGQLDKKFIVCLINTSEQNLASGTADLLAVIDQHAAHERIRLEMLTEEAYEDANKDKGQLCLYTVTPLNTLTFTEDEVRVMVTYREEFKRIGLQFQQDQQNRVCVHVQAVPECLVVKGDPTGKRKTDFIYWNTIEALIKDHVELLRSTSGAKGRFPKVIHRILCSLACHGAIKFGDPLTQKECEALIRDLSRCDLPFQCAHGRPSVMPVLQLEQLETRLPQQKQKKPKLYKLTRALMSEKDT